MSGMLNVAVVVAVVVSVTACTGDSGRGYGSPPTPTWTKSDGGVTSRSPSPDLAQEQQVVAQYERFWKDSLPRAFEASADQRRAILSQTTTDPELSVLIRNMEIQDGAEEEGYGVSTPLRQSVQIKAKIALVRGCLDSSGAGILSVKTGKKLTKGPARNPVLANLARGSDGIWRVSFVKYPGGSKC